MTTGGVPAACLIEKHFRRFVVGQPAHALEVMFDPMYHALLFYGRKGLTINAISAVDCAVWDLLGKLRGEPIWARRRSAERRVPLSWPGCSRAR